jgi:hypothetical protein
MASEGGERGITFGDPREENLATANYSLARFTRKVFPFSAVLRHASMVRPSENENPAAGCGSNL